MRLPRAFKIYSGLPRSIYVLFFARIINSLGAFVYPFLTLFLTDKLGMGEKETGLYFMIAAVVSVPGSFIGGFLSDRIGRKKIIVFFQSLAALMFIPCAFLEHSLLIPKLIILANFFGGAAQPAYSAMLADITNEENRKSAFSLLYLGINVGFAVGPLIAGFLYNKYIEWIFLGDAITTILSLILITVFVEESIPSSDKVKQSYDIDSHEKAEEGSFISVLFRRPALLAFAVVSTIYSFVFAQHGYSIPLQIKEIFGVEIGSKMFGTLMTTNAVVVLVMTLFVTDLTKKIKPILNIAMAGIMCAIGFGMLYFANKYIVFFVSTIIWTIGEILQATNSGVYIANHTPMSHRGRFNSILPIISGTGWAVAPYIMGGVIENHGVRTVWSITFVLAISAAVLMYVLYIAEKRSEKRKAV